MSTPLPKPTDSPSSPTQGECRALVDGKSRLFATENEKFVALAKVWNEHNIGLARLDFNHPSYHQVIGMGSSILPTLLERLRDGEVGWLYAIKCISGVQVDGVRGPEVVAAWLDWGRMRGLIVGRL